MEAQPQRYVEITYQNKQIQLDTLEKLDLSINKNLLNSNHLILSNYNSAARQDSCTNTPGAKKIGNKSTSVKLELPKVNVKTMDDHPVCLTDFKLPPNFIKYIDKNADELDEEIEYDMDEEDNLWLKIINEERMREDPSNVSPVTQEQFELLMDRLEKESYFQQSSASSSSHMANTSASSQHLNSSKTNDSTSEDALCCICLDGECLNSNAILFCDMCNLAVHQECYGVPYIPEGQWLCRRCIQSPSTPVNCILCPNRYGAFKQTDDGLWAHVVCAIWVPEVHFANTVFLEPVIGIENIDKARWKLMCYICRKRNVGACIQCDKSNCYTAFHVTCAQQAGLYMNIREEYVEPEPQKKKKNGPNKQRQSMSGAANTSTSSLPEVRKCAFCDIHTPLDMLSPKTRRAICNSSTGTNINNAAECEEALRVARKARMKKARKILAERRNAPPAVSMPVLPKERVQNIMDRVLITNMPSFFGKLMNYWLMKRYSRNGVPLLRRLQHTPGLKKNADVRHDTSASSEQQTENETGSSSSKKNKNEENDDYVRFRQQLREHFNHCVKLRQDLEKVRLLMELVRKRERAKRDSLRVEEVITIYELNPLNGVFLQRLLEVLRSLDKTRIFYEPVDATEVPSYYDIIKTPMDFSRMQAKLKDMAYHNFSQFENDFNLIINNCLKFNPKSTSYYKTAFKIRENASNIMKQAKRLYDNLDLASDFVQDETMKLETSSTSTVNETQASDEQKSKLEATTIGNLSTTIAMELDQSAVKSEETPSNPNDETSSNGMSTSTPSKSSRRRNSNAPQSATSAAKITNKKRMSSVSSGSSFATNLAINESTPSSTSEAPSPNPSSSTTNTTTTN